jgi:uncharacterized glyoxalase superfamily protein PhnB
MVRPGPCESPLGDRTAEAKGCILLVMPTTSSRPAGAPQVMPYLYYADAASALAFLVDAFGFKEISAERDRGGTVWTAQVSTGDGVVLIGPGMVEFGSQSVPDGSLVTSRTFVYVEELDLHYERSRERGAEIIAEPANHGPNRLYVARDPGGQQWIFASHLG